MADMKFSKETTGIFAAGLLIGKFGKAVLASKKARQAYVQGTVIALKAKDAVADAKTAVQENAQDIYKEAKLIREEELIAADIAEEEELFEDLSDIEEITEEIPDEE